MDHPPLPATLEEEEAPPRRSRRSGSRGAKRTLRPLAALAGFSFFGIAVYVSGRLGVEMARQRTAGEQVDGLRPANSVRLGTDADPVYLAQSPDTLRRFFSAHPSAFERARADLSGLRIRRLQDSMEVVALRVDADAVEVQITSGALEGATYWVHYSQVPAEAGSDPIVAPMPAPPPSR